MIFHFFQFLFSSSSKVGWRLPPMIRPPLIRHPLPQLILLLIISILTLLKLQTNEKKSLHFLYRCTAVLIKQCFESSATFFHFSTFLTAALKEKHKKGIYLFPNLLPFSPFSSFSVSVSAVVVVCFFKLEGGCCWRSAAADTEETKMFLSAV